MNLLFKRRATALRWLGAAILTGAIALGNAGAANAQFATFDPIPLDNSTNYVFKNFTTAPAHATFDNTAGTQVEFSFLNGVPPGLGAHILATVHLTAETFTPASGTTTLNQPLDGAGLNNTVTVPDVGPLHNVNVLSITDDEAGAQHGTNLLTAYFTDPVIGVKGSSIASFMADTLAGDKLFFTSDYLFFGSQNGENSMNVGLDKVNPALSKNADGFLNNFTAGGTTGLFTDTSFAIPLASVTPEPPFIQMGVLMLLGGLVFVRRKRVGIGMPRVAMA